ncbi:ABC transporter C family member 2, putative [Plasmodium malariae]|uniref:ABC transporter C family member 2, putative n=1 Tax=Plasmodium malariae TaxID=5858 RepID=A0A1D3TF72_PLAMA|nr:ABC transporter C family member 2, putative [Plasmodium malariae]SCP03574.1 ABC transporter C family member 2, putative [Plasmodium malariae]
MSWKKGKGYNGLSQGSLIKNISWFHFVTFSWVRNLLKDIKKNEDFKLPKIDENTAIEYYTYRLTENLKKGKKKKKNSLSNRFLVTKDRPHSCLYKHDDESNTGGTKNIRKKKKGVKVEVEAAVEVDEEEEKVFQHRGITLSLIETFKVPLICIAFFHILHNIFLIFVALCIENYILIIKGHKTLSLPVIQRYSNILFGFIVILVIGLDLFFDAMLTFCDYRWKINMEITIMYFLYKINLGRYTNSITNSLFRYSIDSDNHIDYKPNASRRSLDKKDVYIKDQIATSEYISRVEYGGVDICSSKFSKQVEHKNVREKDAEAEAEAEAGIATGEHAIFAEDDAKEKGEDDYTIEIKRGDTYNKYAYSVSESNFSRQARTDEVSDASEKKRGSNFDITLNVYSGSEDESAKFEKEYKQYLSYRERSSSNNINSNNCIENGNSRYLNRDNMNSNKRNSNKDWSEEDSGHITTEYDYRKEADESLEEEKNENDACDINIYNIMFVDTPFLIYYVSSAVDVTNMLIKFSISFYMFYHRMGGESVIHGILLIVFLYSLMFIFQFSSSLFKRKYLKYRDMRISNMHHVLKEYKLMKIFNWESIAFDYINYYRIKEMKFCKIRVYLNSLSNYINTVSFNAVEVAIFFFFIRGELNSSKPINVSSIITPLFLYKSLISGMSNMPTIINNLLEGSINIGRINRYIHHYMHAGEVLHYSKCPLNRGSGSSNYHSDNRNNAENTISSYNLFVQNFSKNGKGKNYEQFRKNMNMQYKKKNLTNFLKFLFFPERQKTVGPLVQDEEAIISSKHSSYGLIPNAHCLSKNASITYLERNHRGSTGNGEKKYSNERIRSEHEGKVHGGESAGTSAEETDSSIIIKLQNCSFDPSRISRNMGKSNSLKNINLTLKNNTIAIIIGNVGSGKTLFFNSILGKFKISEGGYYVKNFLYDMPVLYVPQFHWVSVGTVRSMITFGNRYIPSIYYKTVVQSKLLHDILSFKKKDMRYVNDEHSLSKGQKARICLARALYHHYIHMNDLFIEHEKRKSYDRKLQRNKVNFEKDHSKLNSIHVDDGTTERIDAFNTTSNIYHTDNTNNKENNECREKHHDTDLSTNYSCNTTNGTLNNNGIYGGAQNFDCTVQTGKDKSKKENFANGEKEEEEGNGEEIPIFVDESVGTCLKEHNMSYLYLFDDVFSALDPCNAKDIFYNLFCDKKEIEHFKKNCGFLLTMNENIWNSFLIDDIISDLQYKVDVYKLGNNSLQYLGDVFDYMKKNDIKIEKDLNSSEGEKISKKKKKLEKKKKKEVLLKDMDFLFNEKEANAKGKLIISKSNVKYKKFMVLKQFKTIYSFKIEPTNSDLGNYTRGYSTISQNYIDNELELKKVGNPVSSNLSKKNSMINNYTEILVKKETDFNKSFDKNEEIYEHEFKNVCTFLQAQLKNYYYIYDENNIDRNENEDEGRFKGNIKLDTFTWYFNKLGKSLIIVIIVFMFLSIFLDEIKNVLLFLASTLLRSGDENDAEILKQQFMYLKYFALLPSVSLVTTLTSFMLIAHGIVSSAKKVHTEVLYSILYAPIHAFYNNNLGNIINRFITDINVLDNGIIKRFYKTCYTFFRFLFTVCLLNYLVKHTVFVFPFVMLIIYYYVFKKYSSGCKEAQRGYLCSHSPLCTIYSNTLLGKDIINIYKKNSYFLKSYEDRIYAFRNFCLFKWSLTIWASLYVQLIVLLLTSFYIVYPYLFFSLATNNNFSNGMDTVMMNADSTQNSTMLNDNMMNNSTMNSSTMNSSTMSSNMSNEKNASTIGYCITFSCSLGFIIKGLIYDYTHVEKEMCSTQRLEECSKMIKEKVFFDDKDHEVEANFSNSITTTKGSSSSSSSGGGSGGKIQVNGKKQRNSSSCSGKVNDSSVSTRELSSISPNEETTMVSYIVTEDESKKKYGIHFENVFVSYKKKIYIDRTRNMYYYADEKSCLRNINIYALKYQKIGIVGKSGAGKSTTILSILGLIPTTRGNITIEGRNIRSFSLEERKNIIGVLPQSSFFFLHWNIRTFIDPYQNFSDDDIVDAFKLIGINLTYNDLDKYIHKQKKKKKGETPAEGKKTNVINELKNKKVNTKMNMKMKMMNMIKMNIKKKNKDQNIANPDNFISLSDDCIRYLSLVRIFLNRHKYKLVLIDEMPVLNLCLDNNKLNNFFSSDIKSFEYIIKNYFKNITVLIIAHDASTLSCCDFIYVISKGEVVYKCSCTDVKTQGELAEIIQQQA